MSIVFVSRQAGTANAFVPVIKSLERQNIRIHVFAYPKSEVIFSSADISCQAIESFDQTLDTLNSIENLKLLITGTSFSVEDDSQYWLWGKGNRVITAAFVDQWANYERRFQLDNEKIYPDKILVIDNYTRNIYLDLGLDENNIVVTGSPCFESNAQYVKGMGDPNVILFVSEPYSDNHLDSSWNELLALSQLIHATEKSRLGLEIIIRPHPRETLQKFRQYLSVNHKSTSTSITLSIDSKFSDLSKAGIVVGIKSILILEAFILGRVGACILPNALESNHFTNIAPDIALLYDQNEVCKFLTTLEQLNAVKAKPVPNEYRLSSIDRFIEFVLTV